MATDEGFALVKPSKRKWKRLKAAERVKVPEEDNSTIDDNAMSIFAHL